MHSLSEIKTCEVCGSNALHSVLDLGIHPMCDDLVPVGSSLECELFPIHILYCKACNTAHQKYQVPKARLFPQAYHYRSRFTADVLSGMLDLSESIEKRLGSLAGLRILDIGCNDGSLLDIFSRKGAKTIGVEPTGAHLDASGREHLIFNDYFSLMTAQEILKIHPHLDVITFTNVFAHIEDLPSLLEALRSLMSDDTILVIENHYLGAVLERHQFDTFYHEHPRTYSLHSFVHIAETLGRDVVGVEFPERYGGNIRVVIGKSGTADPGSSRLIQQTLEREANYFSRIRDMNLFINSWKQEKKSEIQALINKHGKLSAKAFPGRAAILIALLGLTSNEIASVYEKPGSLKIGHYVPGTRIPIKSDEALFSQLSGTEVILNLAWHISVEIEDYLRQNGFKGQLLNIV
jgi:SAM-dependent methyltransferase